MNRFDDVKSDVGKLLEEQDKKLPPHDPIARSGDGLGILGRLKALGRLYWTGTLVKVGLYKRLVYAHLKLDWFYEFQDYWVNELGNRPIQPPDFHFLHGVYRQRIQDFSPDSGESCEDLSGKSLLKAWQDSRITYYLFAWHYKLALQPLRTRRFIKFIPHRGHVRRYSPHRPPLHEVEIPVLPVRPRGRDSAPRRRPLGRPI